MNNITILLFLFLFLYIFMRNINKNFEVFLNILIIGIILAYVYYNNTEKEKQKLDLINNMEIQDTIENIDENIYEYINKLSNYKKYKKNINDAIIHINYFYKDMEKNDKISLLKAEDNRKYAINTLLSVRLEINTKKEENEYITLVNTIKTKTEEDYNKKIKQYNKLNKFDKNNGPIYINQPIPLDNYYDNRFSLI